MKKTLIVAFVALFHLSSCNSPDGAVVSTQPQGGGSKTVSKTNGCGNDFFPPITVSPTAQWPTIPCGGTHDVTINAREAAQRWAEFMTDASGNSTMTPEGPYLCGTAGENSLSSAQAQLVGTNVHLSWGFVFCHQYKITRNIDGVTTVFYVDNKLAHDSSPTYEYYDNSRNWSLPHGAATFIVEATNFGEVLPAFGNVVATLPSYSPLTASITGPTEISVPRKNYGSVVGTWNAVVNGGSQPHTYQWKFDGSLVGANSSSYSRSFAFAGYNSDATHQLELLVDGILLVTYTVFEDGYPYQSIQ